MAEILTLEKAVRFAMQIEAQGAEFYAGLARRFSDDEELRDLFRTLSEDEKCHATQFGELQQLVGENGARGLSRRQVDYLEAMALSAFFNVEDGPFHGVQHVQNREEALAKVFSFEKATLAYYQAMKEALGGTEVLDALIASEKQHVISVAKVMIAGGKFRGIADPW